jgi:hypothetical protein
MRTIPILTFRSISGNFGLKYLTKPDFRLRCVMKVKDSVKMLIETCNRNGLCYEDPTEHGSGGIVTETERILYFSYVHGFERQFGFIHFTIAADPKEMILSHSSDLPFENAIKEFKETFA